MKVYEIENGEDSGFEKRNENKGGNSKPTAREIAILAEAFRREALLFTDKNEQLGIYKLTPKGILNLSTHIFENNDKSLYLKTFGNKELIEHYEALLSKGYEDGYNGWLIQEDGRGWGMPEDGDTRELSGVEVMRLYHTKLAKKVLEEKEILDTVFKDSFFIDTSSGSSAEDVPTFKAGDTTPRTSIDDKNKQAASKKGSAAKRGRPCEKFEDCIVSRYRDKTYTIINQIKKELKHGKTNGKQKIEVIIAAIALGYITRPSYAQIKSCFGKICIERAYKKLITDKDYSSLKEYSIDESLMDRLKI